MSLQSNIEEEIAILEKIRQDLMEKGYNPKDINKIIDYINDTVTNISVSIVRESEVSELLPHEKIKSVGNELQSNVDLSFKVLNTELDRKLPSNLKWNLSEDFISQTLNEITPSSAKPTIKKEPLDIGRDIHVHAAEPLLRGRDIDVNVATTLFEGNIGVDGNFAVSRAASRAIDDRLARIKVRGRTIIEPLARGRDAYVRVGVEPFARGRTIIEPLARGRDAYVKVGVEPFARGRAIDEPLTRGRAIDEPLTRDRAIDEPFAKGRAIDEPLTRDRAIDEPLARGRSSAI